MKNNILITGAGGFIGSHLVEHCIQNGDNVTAFVHYNSNNRWGWLDSLKENYDFNIIMGDIRDYDSIYAATDSINIVYHLAALIGIPYSYLSPLAYIKTNIEGTYNILECAKQREIEQVLITSTSETYGTAQYTPIDEEHPMVGQSPYSATKIAADQLALSYFRSFNLPIKIVRPFNTYGPRQSARAFIPTVISQILQGETILKLGNLKPTRDLTYVKDTVKGFTAISKSKKLFGQITNIGMNKDISMSDLVTLITDIIGIKVEIEKVQQRFRPEDSEVERLLCNNKKLIENTNWKPDYTLKEGLQETINWIDKNIFYYKSKQYVI